MKNTNKNNKDVKMVFRLSVLAAITMFSSSSLFAMSDREVSETNIDDKPKNIVGGSESTPNSRPYQVALLMNGRQGCGGTLIGSQWVLTAGHCLDSASTSNLTVKVGAHRMSANDGETIRVSQIIKHENWRGAQSIESGYDIAVLRLASPASSSIVPASLPTQAIANQIASVGTYVTVSGWGDTYGGSRRGSDSLREVALPVITNSSCSSQLGANVGNGTICGGGPNNTSACNGDSGGPFAVSSNGKFYSIGTVSWGKDCKGATAFTRTSAYLGWIEGKTGIKPDGTTTDIAPTARFTASVNGSTVTLSNNSTDDHGISGSHWNFGDNSTSSESNPSHTYAQDGSYTITLEVTDTAGQTGSTAQSVTVGSVCTSTTAASYPTWSASTSYALGDHVSHNGKNYEATWWSTGAKPSIYTNVWKVVGSDTGNNCPDENDAPIAGFSVSTNELVVSFNSSSTDDKAVVSHRWDFGDNTSSTSENPIHEYAQDGNYNVSLRVADAEGLTHSTSQVVSVEGGVVVEPGCDGLTAWSASRSYAVGDIVSYQSNKYTAIWWSTGAQPDVFSNVWTNNGSCSN
jgi:secreted trypsin-like serine protease